MHNPIAYHIVKTTLTLSLLLSLSGCFGALLGATAGGVGSYYAKKEIDTSSKRESVAVAKKVRREEREKYQKEINENISNDLRLTSAITGKMLSGGLTKVISVHTVVKNGVVELFGNVPSQGVADRAIDIARRQPGVKRVVNNLVIVEVKITSPATLKPSKTIKNVVPQGTALPQTGRPIAPTLPAGRAPTSSRDVPLSKRSYLSPESNRSKSVPQIYNKKRDYTPPSVDGKPAGATLTPLGQTVR